MTKFKLVILFVCVAVLNINTAQAQTAAPQAPPEMRAMCQDIEKNINTTAKFAQTSCRVGGGNSKDSVSFLVVALTVVWDEAELRQEWLTAVVDVAGAALNASPDAKVDEIIVADPSQLADRVAWGIPVAVVRNLQGKLKDGSLKKADIFPLIEKELIRKPILSR